MTPRRLDPDSVTAKLLLMQQALDVLGSVGEVSADDLRADPILRGAVERYLMLLVDLAVAVNLHLAASAGRPAARDYTSSFSAAADVGALPADLAEALAGSAGMRNILVHTYAAVDLGRVAAAIPLAHRDYGRYVRTIADFVRRHDPET